MNEFKEFREDGWPLCPQCGEDELYSLVMLNWTGEGPHPSIQECIAGGMRCYYCGWQSKEAPHVP